MRQPYRTPHLPGGRLPEWQGRSLEGGEWRPEEWRVVLGGYGLECLGTTALWLRLLDSEGLEGEAATVLVGGTTPAEAAKAVPRSRHGATYVVSGESLGGDFAWCEGFGAMLGAPTEEAWEAFLAAVLSGPGGPGRPPRGHPSAP